MEEFEKILAERYCLCKPRYTISAGWARGRNAIPTFVEGKNAAARDLLAAAGD
jgi:hypothetical protein